MPVIGSVAVIVVVPGATEVAKPLASMVAAAEFEELQITDFVQSCVVPSKYVPVTANCWVAPFAAMLGFTGVIARDESAVTVNVAAGVAATPVIGSVAVIVVVPGATAATKPFALIVATAGFDELQIAEDVQSCVAVSPEYIPVTS
jgi:hypothetical protein